MKQKHWRVVLRYGHVGKGKCVTVARYLETRPRYTIIDVMDLAADMPAVKSHGVLEAKQISKKEYKEGKNKNKDNFYLQKLFTHKNHRRGYAA